MQHHNYVTQQGTRFNKMGETPYIVPASGGPEGQQQSLGALNSAHSGHLEVAGLVLAASLRLSAEHRVCTRK
jgi:hypothetical protein